MMFFALAAAVGAQEDSGDNLTALAGNLPAVIAAGAQPYIVTTDAYVPSGKTVRIEAGAVLLFRSFTGLHVEGRLVVAGTRDRPVVFTSENDNKYNPAAQLLPNPYDWNGIFIHETGLGTELNGCSISYSVYGINSLTRFIKLDGVTLQDNGRADVTVEGASMEVTAGKPFAYAASVDEARKAGISLNILKDPNARRRNAYRYGSLGVLVVGAGMVAWFGNAWSADNNHLDAMRDDQVVDENSNLVKNRLADFESALSRRNRDAALACVGIGVGILGGVGFTWSFTF